MQASSTTWAHTMTIQKLEQYVHVVDTQHFVCCRGPTEQNESTEVHNPRRDCTILILTLEHETHQTDVMLSELSSTLCIRGEANTPTELELAS